MHAHIVAQFNKAFGIETPDEPTLPALSEADRLILVVYVAKIARMAEGLKESAGQAKGRGRPGLANVLLRLQLNIEETGEIVKAIAEEDGGAVLDGLADLDYVTAGWWLALGAAPFRTEAAQIVHRSNMSKLGPDGKPIIGPSGRVVKPEGWTGPEEALKNVCEWKIGA